MATTRDVARLAMVSAGTVSRVLNHSDNVDEALRERVRKAADQLGYRLPPRRNSAADVRSIGFLLSNAYLRNREDLMTPFWARILHGAEEEAARHAVALHYRTIGPDRAEVRRNLRSAGLDAVMLVGSATEDVLEAVLALDVPTALVDFTSQHHALPAVLSDGLDGGQVAVEHLLARGHRRIAFVGGPMSDPEAGIRSVPALQHRYLGYRIALAAAGVRLDPALVAACDLQPEGVTEATEALLERTDFTAMFCANDQTAVAAMRVLGRRGVRVPQDVSVIGFDDDLAAHSIPALTTMSVPKEAMGRLGVRRLLHAPDGPDEQPYTITLPVELVARDSVADRTEDSHAPRH
ncbi:LacI family DNA-binding transcriptional regulator [Actinacidiphila alni]|nr:LacI family DNA-binding transcriptional regulator [Actinacidiphila alni]